MNNTNKENNEVVKTQKEMPENNQQDSKRKPRRMKLIVILSLVGVLIVAAAVLYVVFKNDITYAIANSRLNSGEDADARQMFLDLGDFEDASDRVLHIDYSNACKEMDKGEYQAAISDFEALGSYMDCPDKIIQCHKLLGEELFTAKDYENARMHFETVDYAEGIKKTDTSWGDELYASDNFEDAIRKWQAYSGDTNIDKKITSAEYEIAIEEAQTGDFSAVIKASNLNLDNRARSAAEAFLIMPLEKTIPLAASETHIAYIDRNGEVHANGSNSHGQCNVEDWQGVVSLCLSELNTYGLRYDGIVLAAGSNAFGQCDVSSWNNIVSLAASDNAVFGLTDDGKVVYTGGCEGWYDASAEWTDITDIAAGMEHIVALDSSGDVFAAGKNHYGQLDVLEATEVSAIACGPLSTILIKNDGSADIIGAGIALEENETLANAASISSSYSHMVLRLEDGSMRGYGENWRGQCNVSEWQDIMLYTAKGTFTVGLKSDGSVLTTVDGHTLDWQVFMWN